MKAYCPLLAAILVQAPTLATLRITDSWLGKAEAPKTRGRAYQLTTKEDKVVLDVVSSMYLFIFILTFPFFMLRFMFLLKYISS